MAIRRSRKEASAGDERLWQEKLGQLVSVEELQSLSEQSLPDTFAAIGVFWVEVAIILTPATCFRIYSGMGDPGRDRVGSRDGSEDGRIWRSASRGLTRTLANTRTLNDRICNWELHFGRSIRSRNIGRRIASTTGTSGRSVIRTGSSTWCRFVRRSCKSPAPGPHRGDGIPEGNHGFPGRPRVRSARQLSD